MHISQDELIRFVVGKISAGDAEQIEAHLLNCADCSRNLDALDVPSGDKLLGLLQRTAPTIAQDTLSNQQSASQSLGALTGQRLGRYEIGHELGRGGMGVVYRAYDPILGRLVAVKTLRADRKPDSGRFRREAESAARLQHANIVQVFEFGEHQGTQFCVFELVEGGSLAEKLDRATVAVQESSKETARLLATLADAVHFAHERQVIHRDLKPANVLFMEDGTPKIADFGLAKLMDDNARQTIEGTLMGSPSYMAPEQAVGSATEIKAVTDIYALGAMLYECLAGRPPFLEDTVLATLDKVRHAEPPPLSEFRSGVDSDLESIALKCLRKEQDQRYATAEDLANDLRRYLAGLPVTARRVGWAERSLKAIKRHPIAAIAGVLFSLFLTAFVVTITVYNFRLQAAIRISEERLDLAQRNMNSVNLRRATEIAAGDPHEAESILNDPHSCPEDLRDFAWHYLNQSCRRELTRYQSDDDVRCLAVAQGGGTFATGHSRGTVYLWSVNSAKPVQELIGVKQAITGIALSPAGALLAASSEDGSVNVWTLSEQTDRRVLKPIQKPVDEISPALAGAKAVNGVAFSPTAPWLAAAVGDSTIRIWDTQTWEEIATLRGHEDSAFRVDFSSCGKWLASGSRDQSIRLWETATWRQIGMVSHERGAVNDVRFHPRDSTLLATAGADRKVRLWKVGLPGTEAAALELVRTFSEFHDKVSGLAFSPTGEFLAAGSYDRTVQVFRVTTGEPVTILRRFEGALSAVAFDSEASLLTGDRNGGCQRWSIVRKAAETTVPGHSRSITGLVFVDSDQGLLTTSFDGLIRVSITDSQLEKWSADRITDLDLSADRQQIVWIGDQSLYTRRLSGPEKQMPIPTDDLALVTHSAALSPLGELIAVVETTESEEPRIRCLDTKSGKPLWEWSRDAATCLAAFPAGDQFAAGGTDQIWLGNFKSGEFHSFAEFPKESAVAKAITFSADCQLLAAGFSNGEIAIYNVGSRRLLLHLRSHLRDVNCVAFSPDGRSLASGGEDGNVLLWDPVTGVERLKLVVNQAVKVIAFSSDSRQLASGDNSGQIRIWPARLP